MCSVEFIRHNATVSNKFDTTFQNIDNQVIKITAKLQKGKTDFNFRTRQIYLAAHNCLILPNFILRLFEHWKPPNKFGRYGIAYFLGVSVFNNSGLKVIIKYAQVAV